MGNNTCCSNKEADKHESVEPPRKEQPCNPSDISSDVAGANTAATAKVFGVSDQAASTVVQEGLMKASKSSEYTIVLDKTSGTRLGVDVDHQDCTTLVIDAITQGLVQRWNRENPNTAVVQGDCIVSVNGVSGDVVHMVEECKKNRVLTMVIQRRN